MVLNFKQSAITTLVENMAVRELAELKQIMLDEINNENQIRIITQPDGFPIEDVNLITTAEGVHALFQPYAL